MPTATQFSARSVKLLERTAVEPKRVDRAAGVIRGVKILGFKSLNGREYTRQALADAVGMYEGCKVNIDHPSNPNAPRSVHDRFGWLENVKLAADGLRGDLRFNPHHKLADRVCWDAENAPDNLGLSHNAIGQTTEGANGMTVHKITRVNSVDLVADPATTKGLFESKGATMPATADNKAALNQMTLKSAVGLIVDKLGDDTAEIRRRIDLTNKARDLLRQATEGLIDEPADVVQESVNFLSLNHEQRLARWRS